MIISFTGTQRVPTESQIWALTDILTRMVKVAARHEIIGHHGACIGSDKIFHDALVVLRDDFGQTGVKIHAHPSNVRGKVAFHANADVIHPAKPPLERNPDIVNPSEVLIAMPKGYEEEIQSGTWTTVRIARKLGIRIIIIWPDGSTTMEPPNENRLE